MTARGQFFFNPPEPTGEYATTLGLITQSSGDNTVLIGANSMNSYSNSTIVGANSLEYRNPLTTRSMSSTIYGANNLITLGDTGAASTKTANNILVGSGLRLGPTVVAMSNTGAAVGSSTMMLGNNMSYTGNFGGGESLVLLHPDSANSCTINLSGGTIRGFYALDGNGGSINWTATTASGYAVFISDTAVQPSSFSVTLGHSAVTSVSASSTITIGASSSTNNTSASNAIAIGASATSTGGSAIAIGNSASVSGTQSISLVTIQNSSLTDMSGTSTSSTSGAQAIAIGKDIRVSGTGSIGLGTTASVNNTASLTYAPNSVTKRGDMQCSIVVMWALTTDATQTEMLCGGVGAARLALYNNQAFQYRVMMTGRRTDTLGDAVSFSAEGLITRGATAGSTALVGTPATSIIANSGTLPWSLIISADTTNGALKFQVTGEVGKTIRWIARVDTVDVGF